MLFYICADVVSCFRSSFIRELTKFVNHLACLDSEVIANDCKHVGVLTLCKSVIGLYVSSFCCYINCCQSMDFRKGVLLYFRIFDVFVSSKDN